jgi:small subunit ribosomal protein S6
MRAYEVMIILDPEVDDAGVRASINRVTELIKSEAGQVATVDTWGRRRLATPINRKHEGTYVVLQIVTEATNLDSIDRAMRLADETLRHKIIRLPDREATKRGLFATASS